MALLRRFKENPLLSPERDVMWEGDSVFNGCPIKIGNEVRLLYRAVSFPRVIDGVELQVSTIGCAVSDDGINFKSRKQLIVPEYEWERYGCEDPRVTKVGDEYYIFYTALSKYPFGPDGIKIGLAISDDLETVKEKHLITHFNSKAMTMFPDTINGKYAVLLSVHTDMPPAYTSIAFFDNIKDVISTNYWHEWYDVLHKNTIPLERGAHDLAEIGAPPIKTEHGWLLFYADIKDYHSQDIYSTYAIESVLLDLDDPTKVIGRTEEPLMVPKESYERKGKVPNVIFPSGALLKDDDEVNLYYGGADTVVCGASLSLSELAEEMKDAGKRMVHVVRSPDNPILEPIRSNKWEGRAVFNPAAVRIEDSTYLLYRAFSKEETSTIGCAISKDGLSIDERLPSPVYVPREPFELKAPRGGLSGCEDPRIVRMEDTLYMTYTGYNGKVPRVVLTSIDVEEFLAREWNWKTPKAITPPDVEDKNCMMFPRKINGKYVFLHRPDNRDIWIDAVEDITFKDERWLGGHILAEPRENSWDSLKIGAAAPPIETEEGWLLLYHGLSVTSRHYRIGAMLLDAEDPRKVLSRTDIPIMQPRMPYEMFGDVPNVVFVCGAVLNEDMLYMYYGGADSVVGVATLSFSELLSVLREQRS